MALRPVPNVTAIVNAGADALCEHGLSVNTIDLNCHSRTLTAGV